MRSVCVVVVAVFVVVVVRVSLCHCMKSGQQCRGTALVSFLSSQYMSASDAAGDSV